MTLKECLQIAREDFLKSSRMYRAQIAKRRTAKDFYMLNTLKGSIPYWKKRVSGAKETYRRYKEMIVKCNESMQNGKAW